MLVVRQIGRPRSIQQLLPLVPLLECLEIEKVAHVGVLAMQAEHIDRGVIGRGRLGSCRRVDRNTFEKDVRHGLATAQIVLNRYRVHVRVAIKRLAYYNDCLLKQKHKLFSAVLFQQSARGPDLSQIRVLQEAAELLQIQLRLQLKTGQGLGQKVNLVDVVLVLFALVQILAYLFHGVPRLSEQVPGLGLGVSPREDLLKEQVVLGHALKRLHQQVLQ